MGDRERIIRMVNLIYNELRIFSVLKDSDELEAQDYLYQNEGDCEIESARLSSADTVLDTTLEDKQGNFSIAASARASLFFLMQKLNISVSVRRSGC